MENVKDIIDSLSSFMVVIKIAFGVVITWLVTRGLSQPCSSCKDVKADIKDNHDKVVKLDAYNKINEEYRKISRKERADINKDLRELRTSQKDTNTKVNNLIQLMSEFRTDTFVGLNIKPKHRTTILIFDDHPTSTDIIKRKLLECGDYSVIHARNISEARYTIDNKKIDYVFADLIHPARENAFAPMGLSLWKYAKVNYPKIKYILYSAIEKPGSYTGLFIPKKISIENLKKFLSEIK